MKRAWKTHDLVDLFRATERGNVPCPFHDNRWFNLDPQIRIKRPEANWPEGYRTWHTQQGSVYDAVEPKETNSFRNFNHARLLSMEGIYDSLRLTAAGVSHAKVITGIWLGVFESLEWTFGVKAPRENKAILQWAASHKTWTRWFLTFKAALKTVDELKDTASVLAAQEPKRKIRPTERTPKCVLNALARLPVTFDAFDPCI